MEMTSQLIYDLFDRSGCNPNKAWALINQAIDINEKRKNLIQAKKELNETYKAETEKLEKELLELQKICQHLSCTKVGNTMYDEISYFCLSCGQESDVWPPETKNA